VPASCAGTVRVDNGCVCNATKESVVKSLETQSTSTTDKVAEDDVPKTPPNKVNCNDGNVNDKGPDDSNGAGAGVGAGAGAGGRVNAESSGGTR